LQSGQPPLPPLPPVPVPEDLHRAMEDLNAEIGVYLGLIYFVVEVFRHDETFGDELSEFQHGFVRIGSDGPRLAFVPVAMEQPLPVYMLGLVSSLRDKPHKGFPVKKVSDIPDEPESPLIRLVGFS
jgi:hypothetical protein